jgi:hypothetical protein
MYYNSYAVISENNTFRNPNWLLEELSVLKYQALDIIVPSIHVWNFYAFWASKTLNWKNHTLKLDNIIVGIRLG